MLLLSSYRKFTFAISSPDEFLVLPGSRYFGCWKLVAMSCHLMVDCCVPISAVCLFTWPTSDVVLSQVHVRTKPCYRTDINVTCNCAVAVREGNNILGVHACDPLASPAPIRYLEDPEARGALMAISPDGSQYTVCSDVEQVIRRRPAILLSCFFLFLFFIHLGPDFQKILGKILSLA